MGSKMKRKTQHKGPEKLIDAFELANITGLTVSFIRKAKDEYELPHYKLGHSLRFRISEVEEWISERSAKISYHG